jgi:hypothetical protein
LIQIANKSFSTGRGRPNNYNYNNPYIPIYTYIFINLYKQQGKKNNASIRIYITNRVGLDLQKAAGYSNQFSGVHPRLGAPDAMSLFPGLFVRPVPELVPGIFLLA